MPEAKFKIAFNWGDEIHLLTDEEKTRGVIIAIKREWNGGVYYEAKFNDESDWYQAVELEKFPMTGAKKEKKEKADKDDEENDGDVLK